tara:strand:- start:12 stop:275 length:264 start_codon:yes stop_codon:yes gene_type:complete
VRRTPKSVEFREEGSFFELTTLGEREDVEEEFRKPAGLGREGCVGLRLLFAPNKSLRTICFGDFFFPYVRGDVVEREEKGEERTDKL